jgi:hypothetical protein
MMRRTWIARLFAAAVVALGVSAAPARAGLLPVSVSVQPEAGNFRWTYSVVLPTDMQLQAGNFFTIYDFGGYVAGSATLTSPFPADADKFWTVSTSNLGPTPNMLNPEDDPNIENITWTYNGPTINTGGKETLGNFSATSLFQDSQLSFFTGTNPRASDGVIDSNITETLTPVGQIIPPPSGVPEPATLALAGLGLPLVGAARWVRRKKK